MTTTFHTAQPHTTVAARSAITISTTSSAPRHNVPGALQMSQGAGAPLEHAFGAAAWALAAVVGIVLGIAIGLVSAGFDTTRLLLAVGAVALGLGWLIALATSPFVVGRTRR